MPAQVLATDPAKAARTVPFDYSFRFDVVGDRSTLNRTVTVSVEGVFRAVSIGFGFVPDVGTFSFGLPRPRAAAPPVLAAPALAGRPGLAGITLGHVLQGAAEALPTSGMGPRRNLLETVLERPIRINPRYRAELLVNPAAPIRPAMTGDLFQVVGRPGDVDIQFLYGLFDDASGREFQSEPVLSTAGLGISNGDRPFRRFPVPIEFAPRSVIRMEVTPVSSDPRGQLFVALHGYKELAPPRKARATEAAAERAGPRRRRRR